MILEKFREVCQVVTQKSWIFEVVSGATTDSSNSRISPWWCFAPPKKWNTPFVQKSHAQKKSRSKHFQRFQDHSIPCLAMLPWKTSVKIVKKVAPFFQTVFSCFPFVAMGYGWLCYHDTCGNTLTVTRMSWAPPTGRKSLSPSCPCRFVAANSSSETDKTQIFGCYL